MKHLISIFMVFGFLFVFSPVLAVDWIVADQKTIAWGAVSTLVTGEPLPASDSILYRVHLKRDGQTEENLVAEDLTDTRYILILDQEGRFFVGVQAVRVYTIDGQELRSESEIAWSDIPINCRNEMAFGLVYLIPPANVAGLTTD